MAKHHQRHQRQPARAARTRARRLTTGGACGQVASRPRFYSSTITDDSGGGSLGRASPTKSRRTRPNKNSLLLRDEQTKLVPASPFIFVVFYNKKHVRENELPSAPFGNPKAHAAARSAPRRPLSNETKKIGVSIRPVRPELKPD